jgi:hypothetical protein
MTISVQIWASVAVSSVQITVEDRFDVLIWHMMTPVPELVAHPLTYQDMEGQVVPNAKILDRTLQAEMDAIKSLAS